VVRNNEKSNEKKHIGKFSTLTAELLNEARKYD
jgi:hypothetical protein